MNNHLLKKTSLVIISFFFVFISLFSLAPHKAEAVVGLPFGGPVLATIYCCNGITLAVGPPTPGTYMVTAGTIVFAWWNVFTPGPHVLGSFIPGGTCLNPGYYCTPLFIVTGTVTKLGTALI